MEAEPTVTNLMLPIRQATEPDPLLCRALLSFELTLYIRRSTLPVCGNFGVERGPVEYFPMASHSRQSGRNNGLTNQTKTMLRE